MTFTTEEPGRLQRLLSRWNPPLSATSPAAVATGDIPEPPSSFPEPVAIVPTDSFALRITGIGGTGVVTVAQILGTAAMLAGFEVRGLDQIGLSQKAGPVVSDLRLSRAAPAYTNRLGERQADLLLAFDQLVAASDKGLATCDRERTVVVGSTSTTPTGSMITHPDIALPTSSELAETIGHETTDQHFWADAQGIADDLLGSTTAANIFVIGMAVQAGALPVEADFIEQALKLNGVAVNNNTAAFRWGRAQISHPETIDRARRQVSRQPSATSVETHSRRLDALDASGTRREQLSLFAHELEAWGSSTDVDAWFDALDRVQAAERAVDPSGTRLTNAAAAGLYKLMAYKDEYEVARLMIDSDGLAEAHHVAEASGTSGSLSYRLHPPMLRALGLDRKISIPLSSAPAIGALAKLKRVRGTMLDPFRWAEVRRVERKLAAEYEAALNTVVAKLSATNLDRAVQIAETPDLVRGYEDIKLTNVVLFRARLAELLAQL